jgi:hypothetical protein
MSFCYFGVYLEEEMGRGLKEIGRREEEKEIESLLVEDDRRRERRKGENIIG